MDNFNSLISKSVLGSQSPAKDLNQYWDDFQMNSF